MLSVVIWDDFPRRVNIGVKTSHPRGFQGFVHGFKLGHWTLKLQ